MEGFSFVTPVTGLNRPNTGKEDDDDGNNHSRIVKHDCLPFLFLWIISQGAEMPYGAGVAQSV
jgi:hypothetical protein